MSDDLIKRLEQAQGPDRELDQAIVIEAPITTSFLQSDGKGVIYGTPC